MFWLFDTTNSSNSFKFLQIFPYYLKYKDSGAGCINLLYDFTSSSTSIYTENKEYNLELIEPVKVNYTIKMKDSYIQYSNNTSSFTFQFENEFIKETDELNILKIPFFKWNYMQIDNHKLPNISPKYYDFYYQNVSFTIYKISENKLFIIELINNIAKKYILEKNLN